ncbi:MAG: TonB-dependent receptor plug domain-containing protein [Thermodesulfobacteriota bacterium]
MNYAPGKIFQSFAVFMLVAAFALSSQGREPEEVVTIGSRFGITEAESAVPVEVITREELMRSGATNLKSVVENILPSFTLEKNTVSDATDAYATAQMRGLGPDQILVLVNGKRRHQYPVPSFLSPIGAGATGTDLSAIPVGAVERIEILGPGAAAQYGSDAIAGVINIVLKSNHEGVHTQTEVGQTYEGDGETVLTSLNMGFGDEKGFVNLTLEYRERGETNRSGPFNLFGENRAFTTSTPGVKGVGSGDTIRPAATDMERTDSNLFIVADEGGNLALANGPDVTDAAITFSNAQTGFDSTKILDENGAGYPLSFPLSEKVFQDEVYYRGLRQGIVRQRIGQVEAEDYSLWLNSRKRLGPGAIYAFGGYNRRKTDSAGFYRPIAELNGRTVPEIYGEGHLPNIVLRVQDFGITAGYDFAAAGIDWDLSYSFGGSRIAHRERNTVNISYYYEPIPGSDGTLPVACLETLGSQAYRDGCDLYRSSQREFDTGTLGLTQHSVNLDATVPIDWGVGTSPLNFAFGTEWRIEQFEIKAGDAASYQYGRGNDGDIEIGNYFCTIDDPLIPGGIHPNCGNAASGSQGFPGYQDRDEIEDSRNVWALYVQGETDFIEALHTEISGRYEWYSDFGSTINGKLSARYDVIADMFSLRGNIATGFRAPGIQQLFFQHITTDLVDGVLTDTQTVLPDGPAAKALGFRDLEEETSITYGIGFASRPFGGLSLTFDAYRIDIDDRIIYSNNLQRGVIQELAGDLDAEPANATERQARAALDEINKLAGSPGTFRLFTNGINTETYGLDFTARYHFLIGEDFFVNLGALFHLNNTKVTKRRAVSSLFSGDTLITDHQVRSLEKGTPRRRLTLSTDFKKGAFALTLRSNYYGSVEASYWTDVFSGGACSGENADGCTQKFGGSWFFDAEISAEVRKGVTFSVGALNLFDQYPDKLSSNLSFAGAQGAAQTLINRGFVHGWESSRVYPTDGGYYYVRLTTDL